MNRPQLPLAGKVVWVTGAGKGLGRAIAGGLIADGSTLVVDGGWRAW